MAKRQFPALKEGLGNAVRRKGKTTVRPTRTFKLTVSPDGFDLLVDCHFRLVREARTLVAYGTTLNVAMHHLHSRAASEIRIDRRRLDACSGSRLVFVGAPRTMSTMARAVCTRLTRNAPASPLIEVGQIYLMALDHLLVAPKQEVEDAFLQVVGVDHHCS